MKTNFKKSLGLLDATTIVAGSMIGSGIFIVSSDIARQVDSSLLLIIVWLIAGIMTVAGGLCYGELAAAWPQAGGQYVYIKNIWGKLVGFLYGWTLFLVIQTGTIAAVAVAFAKFFNILVPQISSENILLNIFGLKISVLQAFAISIIALLTYINTRGVKMGAIVQNIFTITKVAALIGIILCGLFIGLNHEVLTSNFSNLNFSSTSDINIFSVIAIALVGALFSSDAWFNVTFIAAEIKNPEKNLPKSLFLGTGLVILLYILTNITFLSVLSLEQIKTAPEDIIGAALIGAIFGDIGKIVIAIIILISAFGCANGIILAGARVFYAMAKDGLFFKSLAKLDDKTNVPSNALIIQGIWASILILSGSYLQLLDYVIFAALLFYILTVGGLFIFRRKYPNLNKPYKTVLYPYLPAFYCILAGFTAINLLIFKPVYTWSGLAIVLAGIPIYYLRTKFNIKQELKEIEEATL